MVKDRDNKLYRNIDCLGIALIIIASYLTFLTKNPSIGILVVLMGIFLRMRSSGRNT